MRLPRLTGEQRPRITGRSGCDRDCRVAARARPHFRGNAGQKGQKVLFTKRLPLDNMDLQLAAIDYARPRENTAEQQIAQEPLALPDHLGCV